LPIRVRHTTAGNGSTTRALSVYCAPRRQSLSIIECERCPHCHGATRDGSALYCDRAQPTRRPGGWEQLVRRAFPSEADRTPIADVMSRRVCCVRPDVTIEAVTKLLLENGFSGAPVVDEEGHPMGVISKTDLLRLGADSPATPPACATVGDVMMPMAFSLDERVPLALGAAMMATEGVHRLPIVDADGKVVGILSALDILRWMAEQEGTMAARPVALDGVERVI
jgi:CBS domain-containing protein